MNHNASSKNRLLFGLSVFGLVVFSFGVYVASLPDSSKMLFGVRYTSYGEWISIVVSVLAGLSSATILFRSLRTVGYSRTAIFFGLFSAAIPFLLIVILLTTAYLFGT